MPQDEEKSRTSPELKEDQRPSTVTQQRGIEAQNRSLWLE